MRRWRVLAAVFLFCILWQTEARGEMAVGQKDFLKKMESGGADISAGQLADMVDRLGLASVEEYLAGQPESAQLSLRALMDKLMAGDAAGIGRDVLCAVRAALFGEIVGSGRLIGQILLLGILGAVFTNFSSIFENSQISETGFFVICLLMVALLTVVFGASLEVAAKAVGTILGFMRVLMPAYFLAVAFAGGTVSAAAMYELVMAGMAGGEWILQQVMLPMVRAYLALALAGSMVKENHFSRLTKLVQQAVEWGLRTLLGAVLGLELLQTLVLPYVDSLKNGAFQKVAGMIPGIGQGAAAVTQMLLGAGVLIKNSIGMAAVIILVVLAAVPVAKLFILMILCQCAAAVLEPVCDKRFLACVSAAAEAHRMLLRIVVTAVFLWVATVALVCAGTNAAYLT